MKFAVAFVATLACAFASPSAYSAYAPYAAAAQTYAYNGYSEAAYGYPYASYAGAYAHSVADIKVLPNGYLADTPEVAHAKAAHEVAKGYVAAAAAASPDYDSYSHRNEHSTPYPYAAPAYPYAASAYSAYAGAYAHAPAADIKVLPSGFLADTPEVAHAKAAHLAEKAKVASKSAYYTPAPYAAPAYAPYAYAAPAAYAAPYAAGYYGHSVADIKVLPSGYLADTPEVAHAKAAHFAEKAKASAVAAASPDHGNYEYSSPPYAYAAPAYSYSAPAYAYAAPAYAYSAPAYSYKSSAYSAPKSYSHHY